MEKLERTLSDVQSDLNQKPPETSDKPTKVKKVAKKAAKKVSKKANGDAKAAKASKKESGENRVMLADLASEAKITGASARRRLRDAELSPEGRWSWEEGSKALKEARKVLGLEG